MITPLLSQEKHYNDSHHKIVNIGGIKTVVTEDHNEVFSYWVMSQLSNASLLHIDAHDDMRDGVIIRKLKRDDEEEIRRYTSTLRIANFICPAIHYGIIREVYWINPLLPEDERYVDLGIVQNEEQRSYLGRRNLATRVIDFTGIRTVYFENPLWDPRTGIREQLSYVERTTISKISGPIVLDIDLDAFCCRQHPSEIERGVDTITGYEERIMETAKLLKSMARPELITITRSQGTTSVTDPQPYVPPSLVDKVQNGLLSSLAEVYE